ncbi:alkane hydroxylase MAH1-like [Lotus japonicus]|uniref:alkane hydroxylase MAH1-like n=1 Tax=Lotus japonicus TaxID=34305 RepID=UPI0025882700|nr:alkane hydroxylase MAH1-like [Lotus japonicus]
MLIYACTIAALLCFLLHIIHRRQRCRYPLLIDYPILGMFPPILLNLTWIHDFVTELLKQHEGKTADFMGPWFTKMDFIVTSNPINVRHITIKKFHNYVKGPEFREIFHAFGGAMVANDSETWKHARSLLSPLVKQTSFESFYQKTTRKKLHSALLPLLDQVQKQGMVVDLQEVFNRFTFDNICSTILGFDPGSLSIDFPKIATEIAFNEAEECMFYRHIVPRCVWKLQEWLQIGPEKKMSEACKTFDQFLYSCIESKRKELKENDPLLDDQAHVDNDMPLLTTLIREEKGKKEYDNKFIRDSVYGFLEGGRSTIASALTWFFWLVAKNPLVEAKILEEIKDNFGDEKKLVYLHADMYETMRLYPPVPFERKQAIEADVLPSGHHVHANAMILFSLYAMGRFEDVWGEDCLEFKPERWISDRGGIVYVPSYKFFSFNAGPRTCLGKDMSLVQLKMVAATILRNYRIHPVEVHVPIPSYSIILLMKDGFKVRVTKREP